MNILFKSIIIYQAIACIIALPLPSGMLIFDSVVAMTEGKKRLH